MVTLAPMAIVVIMLEKTVWGFVTTRIVIGTIAVSSLASVISNITIVSEGSVELDYLS